MAADRERLALAIFLATSILAGGNAVAVRFSNRELDPLWGAGLRFVLAAALLAGLAAVMRLSFPRGRALAGAVLYGLVNFALGFTLAYYAYVDLHAGVGQTLLALVPLLTLLLAVLQRQERLRAAAVGGTVLALAGVAVMSSGPLERSVPVTAILLMIATAACFAEALVLVRRLPPIHPVTLNAVGMATGGIIQVALAVLVGAPLTLPRTTSTWVALVYVTAFGSVAVFVLSVVLLRFWVASRVAYQFVVMPIFALALSAWLDAEPVGLDLVAGGLLVIAGVYVGALRPAVQAREGARPRGEGPGASS